MNNIEQLKEAFRSTRLEAREAYKEYRRCVKKHPENYLLQGIFRTKYTVSWHKHMEASMALFLAECEGE